MEKWFSKGLMDWYLLNKRDLPWRHIKDPYKIWLSEIILQQTQVAQGLSYYTNFTKSFPTVKHLAQATEDQVLKLWQGLGYYSRARNMHYSAKTILNEYKGHFPGSYEEIRALKGVGDYTAAAIASFAYNLPHAVVDGNVYRVLSRVFGVNTPIDTTPAKKEFQNLADVLLDKKDPATYNQAIMEFGSQYCKPANPDCQNCILKNKCYAFKNAQVGDLPVKAKKTKVRNRYFNYVVLVNHKKEFSIFKRDKGDIWQGLYEFPLIETKTEMQPDEFLGSKEFVKFCPGKFGLTFVSKNYKHILSHQHLYARFYVIRPEVSTAVGTRKNHQIRETRVSLNKLSAYAFPRLIMKFLDDCDLKEML